MRRELRISASGSASAASICSRVLKWYGFLWRFGSSRAKYRTSSRHSAGVSLVVGYLCALRRRDQGERGRDNGQRCVLHDGFDTCRGTRFVRRVTQAGTNGCSGGPRGRISGYVVRRRPRPGQKWLPSFCPDPLLSSCGQFTLTWAGSTARYWGPLVAGGFYVAMRCATRPTNVEPTKGGRGSFCCRQQQISRRASASEPAASEITCVCQQQRWVKRHCIRTTSDAESSVNADASRYSPSDALLAART